MARPLTVEVNPSIADATPLFAPGGGGIFGGGLPAEVFGRLVTLYFGAIADHFAPKYINDSCRCAFKSGEFMVMPAHDGDGMVHADVQLMVF